MTATTAVAGGVAANVVTGLRHPMRIAIWMALLIVIENVAGIFLSFKWGLASRPLSAGVVATMCTAFVALLSLGQSPQKASPWNLTASSMRSAIAGTMLIVYLVILGIVVFWVPTTDDSRQKLPDLTSTFVSNFTYLMGVVMAFYFSTSAYVQAKGKEEGPQQAPNPNAPQASNPNVGFAET